MVAWAYESTTKNCHVRSLLFWLRLIWLPMDCIVWSFFSCDQASLWMVQSTCLSLSVCLFVSPSVRPSVHLSLCYHHRIIKKFPGVNAINRSDVREKGQGQRSKVNVTGVKTDFSRSQTITPIWIHIWQWDDAQSLMRHKRGALFVFKVINKMLTRIGRLGTVTQVWIHRWLWNDTQSLT